MQAIITIRGRRERGEYYIEKVERVGGRKRMWDEGRKGGKMAAFNERAQLFPSGGRDAFPCRIRGNDTHRWNDRLKNFIRWYWIDLLWNAFWPTCNITNTLSSKTLSSLLHLNISWTPLSGSLHWVPLIWAAFLRAKSAHVSRKTLNQKYFSIWKAIWGSNILPK